MLKSTEIKELFVQFESAAAEIEGVECWSEGNCNSCWDIPNGKTSIRSLTEPKTFARMQARKSSIIFLTSGKR